MHTLGKESTPDITRVDAEITAMEEQFQGKDRTQTYLADLAVPASGVEVVNKIGTTLTHMASGTTDDY